MLYSVWDSNTRMSDSMVTKRSYVQRLRQEVKLGVVLKEQVRCVEISDIFIHHAGHLFSMMVSLIFAL